MPAPLLLLAWIGTAVAGNARGNLFGSEAALTGGAMGATTRAAEATWYNPAGLGGSDRTRLSVNLSAFVLRIRPFDALITTQLLDQTLQTPADATQLVAIPSSISLVRRVSDRTALGIGVYVTSADRTNVIASARDQVASPWAGTLYTRSLQLLSETQQYHLGLSFGTELPSERVRIGGSLMGVYDLAVSSQSFLANLQGTEQGQVRRATLDANDASTYNAIGIRSVVSVQWEFVPSWHVGLVARTPVLGFYRWGKYSTSRLVTQDVEPTVEAAQTFLYEDGRVDGTQAVQVDPMRIALSFGVVRPTFSIGVEGEVAFGVVSDTSGQPRRVHGNVALGGRFRASERVWIGAGLFTDLSPFSEVTVLASTQDYFGGSLGTEIRNPIRARGREDGVVFSTTFGLRYAAGVGTFGATLFDARLSAEVLDLESVLRVQPHELVFHELSVLVGSSVAF
ncbi:MAG: hypothetical protein H6732_09375 [Alphaproteobacteria bacterium]|nr:hypothetical protein [Alphaproteobacteria bacterium]